MDLIQNMQAHFTRSFYNPGGTRWHSWLRHGATSWKVDFHRCHWNFSLTSSRPHYGPWVDSASNSNEYQEYFLGVKSAGVWGWQTYHFHVPIVLKSGSLNLLEPSGPAQDCNGIALPLPLPIRIKYIILSNWVTLEPKRTQIHPLNRKCKIRREFVKDHRQENTAEDLWTGPRGGYLEN